MEKGNKRKKGNYYSHVKPKKGKYRFVLEPGIKGFICTCNNKEKECVRESYNILNEYADRIYGEEKWKKTNDSADAEDSDDDIDKALEQEIEHLKADRQKAPSQRRFQVVESGANNCLFIRSTVDDPVKLVVAILKDLETTKKQKSRFLLRMIPIEITCKAWPEDIKQAADKLLDKYFLGGEKKSFSVVFNRRNNNNVPRDEVIQDLAAGVRMRNPLHQADLKRPDFSIIVEIIRNMCCLAVVPDYFKYRRYNLLEVCANKDAETPGAEAKTSTDDKPVDCVEQDESAKVTEQTELKASNDENPVVDEEQDKTKTVNAQTEANVSKDEKPVGEKQESETAKTEENVSTDKISDGSVEE